MQMKADCKTTKEIKRLTTASICRVSRTTYRPTSDGILSLTCLIIY